MPNIAFLRRALANNSETTVAVVTNGTISPQLTFSRLYVISPTGANYFIVRVYKDSVLLLTFATNSISQNQNVLVDENISVMLEPGNNLSITINNLDSTGVVNDFEGQLVS